MQTYYAIPTNTHTVRAMSGMGTYVWERRTQAGLNQRALGDLSGVDRSYLAQIESGRIALPGADIRRRLAKALGVTHLDLLIAAGEITEGEVVVSGVSGVVEVDSDDPRTVYAEIIQRIPIKSQTFKTIRAVIDSME